MTQYGLLNELSGNLVNGAGCRIAIYDQNPYPRVRRLEEIENADEHVRRITGFLTDQRLNGFASGCELLSANLHNCLEHGYDTVKARMLADFGPVHIEAHAYSAPTNLSMVRYEQQIAHTQSPPSLTLCSPGHDAHRVRFPATSSTAISVGLWRDSKPMVGAGPGELLKPTLLVLDQPYPAWKRDGSFTQINGTSPAVVFVAGLAALLHQQLHHDSCPLQLHAALLLLSSPCADTYLLNRLQILRQYVSALPLTPGKGRHRRVTLRVTRTDAPFCRLAIVANPCASDSIVHGHRFALTINASTPNNQHERNDYRSLLILDNLDYTTSHNITLDIDGLANSCALAWTGAHVEVLSDNVTPVKSTGDSVVVGISASHDASAVLALNGRLIAGIQLERLTRIKHDGAASLSHEQAIRYCLDITGLTPDDVDCFAFNVQSLTPTYVGLSQPLSRNTFTLFDPLGPKALFISHHLCHAYAGYSASHFDQTTVVVADGSGGVTVGHDDLVLNGPQLHAYLLRGKADDPLRLHTFSVYEFSQHQYRLTHREYAPSFNIRSGSESLGETYAAVSQLVFGSWQASGKLMGLAPYGDSSHENSYLHRDRHGELNFSFAWKISPDVAPAGHDVMRFADLAARIQADLETALIDRFQRHVGNGSHLAYSGGLALNSVANHRIRTELWPRALSLLPAQHDAGVAIGAAAAAIHRLTGRIPNDLFQHDFLGYRYSERDVALAINAFADRLNVRRITAADIATRIADGAVFGFFSLAKGSEFGPRALGARSILADPRQRSGWNFVNKWIKYREEFRPFAPMVTAEALTTFFEADGAFPYMLEVVKVREAHRATLAGVTHIDGSARVQTVDANDDPEIHALLVAFQTVSGVPILLNTSFNVRGQPMVEQPRQALEMLLSTQLSGVIFGDLLVELPDATDDITPDDTLAFSPGTRLELVADQDSTFGILRIHNQGKIVRLQPPMQRALQAIASGGRIDEALRHAGPEHAPMCLDLLRRFVRLRMLNRQHPTSDRVRA
ncbi:carbamoyltransferase C-terminal domain-containing protein [Burkholderia cenocepacia]|uniref:carbamoyltransferase C-terminal domain-containing protein n=1 Tax=Burkholderia cenocepacia TaxID=95486 RepID=UPI000F5978BA|nr:carbamoyltransferase C-terminal domain-containing protein [Burkholderia cenocepacia]RQU50042.1 hypothetical protein DF143_36565 [Burkholderia cenocepacia]RQV33876.1 hypothetical protein DF033_34020 [Burkholderia cenocepacia]